MLHKGLYDDATDAFIGLLREEPDSDEINVGFLVAAFQAKRYTHALLACERLLGKYPQDTGLRLQLAIIYMALGERKSARMELRKAKPFGPS